jgi:hypothetical protein
VVLAWILDGVGEEGWSPMTETLVGVSPLENAARKSASLGEAEPAAVRELVKGPAPAVRI